MKMILKRTITLVTIKTTFKSITARPLMDEILAIASIPCETNHVITIIPIVESNATVKVGSRLKRC